MPEPRRLVLPGEEIGTEEEYVAGPGTYVEDAHIRATIAGPLQSDNRVLSVEPPHRLSALQKGSVVLGQVANIVEPVALVVVEPEKTPDSRFSNSNAYCILHVSYIKRGFVKNIRDELRIGDLIRARVVEFKNNEFHLSTDDDNCGVIKAYCSSCRHALEKKPTGLQCTECGRRENRKLAPDYRVA